MVWLCFEEAGVDDADGEAGGLLDEEISSQQQLWGACSRCGQLMAAAEQSKIAARIVQLRDHLSGESAAA